MKHVITGRSNNKAIFNVEFDHFCRHYGFKPVVCPPYSPNVKGKVERPVDLHTGRLLARLQLCNNRAGQPRLARLAQPDRQPQGPRHPSPGRRCALATSVVLLDPVSGNRLRHLHQGLPQGLKGLHDLIQRQLLPGAAGCGRQKDPAQGQRRHHPLFDDDRLQDNLSLLKLTQAAEVLDAILKKAEAEKISYMSFLDHLLEEEVAAKEKRRVQTAMKTAGLPCAKTAYSGPFRPLIPIDPGHRFRLIPAIDSD